MYHQLVVDSYQLSQSVTSVKPSTNVCIIELTVKHSGSVLLTANTYYLGIKQHAHTSFTQADFRHTRVTVYEDNTQSKFDKYHECL